MSFTTTTRDNTFEVKLTGRLGFEDHADFRDILETFLSSDCKEIKFLLSELNEIDSSGLGMFLLAKEMASAKGLSVSLAQPTGRVKSLFELSDFASNFHITS